MYIRSLHIFLSIFIFVFQIMPQVVPQAYGQVLSGRSVDTTAIEGAQHSCRLPAVQLQQRIILLRQGIQDIINCNAQGGLFQSDGTCRLAVHPAHDYRDPAPAEPEGRSGLSFRDIDGNFSIYGIIGGIDGNDVTCRRVANCTPDFEERTELCPDGTTIVVETRQFICPEGIFTEWEPTGEVCLGGDPDPEPEPEPEPGPCTHNGIPYEIGEGFTLYKAIGQECDTCDSRNFTCTENGIQPNPANYPNFIYSTLDTCLAANACEGGDGNQCIVDGQVYEDGETFSRYKSLGNTCGTCNNRVFTCDDGVVTPPLENYPNFVHATEGACLAANPCGDCNLPSAQGGVLPHGQSRQLFAQTFATCSDSCSGRTVSCVNGQLSSNYSPQLNLQCAPFDENTAPHCFCTHLNEGWQVGTTRHFLGPGDGRHLKCCEGIALPGLPHGLFVDVSHDNNSGGEIGGGNGTDEHCF